MNTLHSTWRRIRTVISDTNYVTGRLTDPRVTVHHQATNR
jgi:hypothetical protein